MSLEPLFYVWSTVSIWHAVALFTVVAVIGIAIPILRNRPVMWSWIPFGLASFSSSYALLALLVGQLFGDKYSFNTLWPTAFVLALAFVALPLVNSATLVGQKRRVSFGTACVAVLLGAPFFTRALWILYRAAA